MTKEKQLWLIVQNILDTHGDQIDGISIHDDDDFRMGTENFKIYHHDGFCWELQRESMCDPDDVDDVDPMEGVDDDGFVYSFAEPWDGFKESGIDKAIEILGTYGQPIESDEND